MEGKREERDAAMARLAGRQHGVVAYRQLIRLGFSEGAIEHRLRKGILHRLHKGVYAVGHPSVSREGEFMAAVFTGGPDAVLSHWSAAEHWKLLKARRALIAISAPTHRRASKLVKPHWIPRTHESERTRRDGIPITTVPRTLLDLAAVAPPKQLQRAVNEAERLNLLNKRAMRETLERHSGRRGTPALRAVIAAVNPETRRTRSDLEVAFLALCKKYGIPLPVVNGVVEGYEVDMHWPGTSLIVELDSWEYHGTSGAFETDRRRDADLASKGYRVIRVTGDWIDADPAGVATAIRTLLTT
jgi:predicted transcriptional regulator of viral defense system